MPSTDMAAHMYDQVIGIINKVPEERTNNEIGRILPWFRKKSELFKELRNEIVQDIVKNCEFKCVERDTVIIKQGDKGDCFFIILNGSVAILINTTFGSEEDQPDGSGDENDKSKKKEEDKKLDRSIYGTHVGKIDSGKSFGELALINADCVRNATIIADETTDLVVVNRELYNRSLRAFQAKEFEERKHFVESNRMFSNWQPKYKKQLAMSLRKEKVTFDAPIIRQGSTVNGLCFLLSGQAKLIVESSMHPVQYPSYFPLTDVEDLEKIEARDELRRELSMPTPKHEDSRSLVRSKSPLPENRCGKRSPQSHRHTEICLIGNLEIIGDLELITGLPTYAHSAICTQEAEYYILDQKNYDRLIEKRNPKVLDLMRDDVREKYALRLSWVSNKDLPLIRYLLYKMDEKDRQKRIKSAQRNSNTKGTTHAWMNDSTSRGPVIDMYGPGSVFYSIRMKEKQRKLEKMRYGPQGHASREGKKVHPRNVLPINSNAVNYLPMQDEKTENTEGFRRLNEQVLFENDENDATHLICDNEKFSHLQGQTFHVMGSAPKAFSDKESNDDNLKSLEARIEAWHNSLPANDSRRQAKKAVKLHRLDLEERQKPLPGKKVILRQKVKHKSNFLDSVRDHNSDSDELPPYSPPMTDVQMSDTGPKSDIHPEDRSSKIRRPMSCRSEPILTIRRRRPKSARQYTMAEYEALKQELRQKQRAFKSLLGRPRF